MRKCAQALRLLDRFPGVATLVRYLYKNLKMLIKQVNQQKLRYTSS